MNHLEETNRHSRGTRGLNGIISALALAGLCVCWSCSSQGPAAGQLTFETPERAVTVAIEAARAGDQARMLAILGPEAQDICSSGDPVRDRADRSRFLALYEERNVLERGPGDTRVLVVGSQEWPFPIPLATSGGRWFFDTAEGRQEILDRRIGRNELDTIETCRAFCDAQDEYYEQDRDGDGILEYARKFRSSTGKQDGLYWPTAEGEPPSPLGALAAEAAGEGYDVDRQSGAPRAYHGYYFRLLTRQGPSAPGGAYEYLAGEAMIGGFALVAWPASYEDSGVMSFLVNQDGVVYEKDLGPDTDRIARAMTAFDPDRTWKPCKVEAPAAEARQ